MCLGYACDGNPLFESMVPGGHAGTMRTLLISLALFALGCADSHGSVALHPGLPDVALPEAAPATLELAACLEGGGSLEEVATVNNDDTTEHGDVLTFAVAPDRRIAVAAEDGTIKLWTLEGFLGALEPGMLTYGPELGTVPVNDLAFDAEWIIAGDAQGLVGAWTMEGGFRIVGGTDPGIRIDAVALDHARRFVAHADEREGGHVMVRSLDDATMWGPLETGLTQVRDLAYHGERLLLAGGDAVAAVELRDAEDPTLVVGDWYGAAIPGAVREVAVSPSVIAAATPAGVVGLDGGLGERWQSAHVARSVSVTPDGAVVFAATDGALVALGGEAGEELATIEVDDPVTVRIDPAGGVVLAASRGGLLHAFACR